MTDKPITAAQEWRAYWTVVFAGFIGFSFLSIMTGSLSMFMGPVGSEFGWSRTLVSSGFTIASMVTAILSPFIGILVDRYGSRRIALPGIVATSLCIAAFSFANGSATQWVMLWLVYAVIGISVKTTVWTSAVASIFKQAQGLAIGLVLAGTAAAQAILPPIVDALISNFGWRMAYAYMGLGWGAVTFVVCWFFLYGGHERQMAEIKAGGATGERPTFAGLTIAEAWRNTALWRIVISTFVIMLLTLGLSIHQIPILTEAGIDRTTAAWLATMAGISSIAGKLITGVLLDRWRANWIGGLSLAASAFAFGLLIDGINTPTMIVIAMLINGYTQGVKLQIASYLTARYAGMRNFGKIYGFLNAVIAFGSGMGPVVAGFAYDSSGDYTIFLIVGVIGSIVSGLLILSLPRYPVWDEPTDVKTGPA